MAWPLSIPAQCKDILMDVQEDTRLFERRPCKGEVLVHSLGGGPPIKAELRDLGKGGARLILDRPVSRGQGLRLVFPRKSGQTDRSGRMIVGHVVYSRVEDGRHLVGVAFGWHAAVKETPRPMYRKTAFSWIGLFSRKARTPSRVPMRTR
jgi:hypothetical protein